MSVSGWCVRAPYPGARELKQLCDLQPPHGRAGRIDARDHCTALVFRPERLHQERTGNWFLDVLGFERTTVNYGWSAEVVLLIQDGRVAYKVMSGRPNVQDDKILPADPFQGGGAMRTAARAASL